VALGITPEVLAPHLAAQSALLKTGKINESEFWNTLEASVGSSVPVSARDVWVGKHEAEPDPQMVQFVKKLQQDGYRTAVLSNTFPRTASDIKSKGWYDIFSPVLLSSDIGLAKPNVEFYKLALQQLDTSAQEVIYIDDQEKCLVPAQGLGMKTVHAKNAQQIIADVSKLLDA
jgi:putative hydrolase of the HAD superfamily